MAKTVVCEAEQMFAHVANAWNDEPISQEDQSVALGDADSIWICEQAFALRVFPVTRAYGLQPRGVR